MKSTIYKLAERGDLEELKKCTDDVNVPDITHWVPLEYAIRNNDLDCVKYLVEQRGAIVNKYDENGCGPIHMAARYNLFDCLQYLVKNGANVNAITRGQSPFSLAIVHGYLDCAKYLYSNGANPFIDIRAVAWDGDVTVEACISSFIFEARTKHKERQSIQAMMSVKQIPRFGQQSSLQVLPTDIIRRLHTYFV
jgi:hypothetical protein